MKAQAMAMLPRMADLHRGSVVPASARARARPSFLQRLAEWSRVARERRRLMGLDEHILKDIGLTPEEAYREATRPFWDIEGRR